MKTIPPRIAGLVFFASALTSVPTSLRAQDDGPPSPIISRAIAATVDYGNGGVFNPRKSGADFERLGFDPGQQLTITVQFPLDLAGQSMIVEQLDGGLLNFPDGGFVVDSNGNVTIQFQAIDLIGLCRIAVHQPDDQNTIQLWVVDPDHPENTPPNLAGLY
jgi:hypothetical protein